MARQPIELIGGKGLQRALDRLGKPATRRRVERKVNRAGLRVVRPGIKAAVPTDEGVTKRATGSGKPPRAKRTDTAAAMVIVRARLREPRPVNIIALLEMGTVNTRPQPFIRPELQSKGPQAMTIMERVALEEIGKEFSK